MSEPTRQLGGRERQALVGLVLVAGVASGIAPVDRYTWGLEVAIVIGVGALLTWLRPPVTPGLARLLATYALVMLVGAHYTYGQAPPGEWLADWLGLERNPYDRIGHLLQGWVPAYAVLVLAPRQGPASPGCEREASRGPGAVLRRSTRLLDGSAPWLRRLPLGTLALAAGLGTVALFEGLELAFAALAPAGLDFVQAQGDPHDTAWDVAFAALGSLGALALLPGTRPAGSPEGEPAGCSAMDRRP